MHNVEQTWEQLKNTVVNTAQEIPGDLKKTKK